MEMMPDVGTIVIQYPNPRHEGIYQCTAKNEFGIAISSTAMLKMAGDGLYTCSQLLQNTNFKLIIDVQVSFLLDHGCILNYLM